MAKHLEDRLILEGEKPATLFAARLRGKLPAKSGAMRRRYNRTRSFGDARTVSLYFFATRRDQTNGLAYGIPESSSGIFDESGSPDGFAATPVRHLHHFRQEAGLQATRGYSNWRPGLRRGYLIRPPRQGHQGDWEADGTAQLPVRQQSTGRQSVHPVVPVNDPDQQAPA